MKLRRMWAMPNKWTFQIEPVRKLLNRYVKDGRGWIDPMAGFNSPAEITNDGNEEAPTKFHMDALEFLRHQPSDYYGGVLFDPPYSYEKAKRLYKKTYPDSQVFYNYIRSCKRELCRIVKAKGLAILFGWNSNGLGKKNGFQMVEVLLIPHGWNKIDTIVTVERKVQTKLAVEGKE